MKTQNKLLSIYNLILIISLTIHYLPYLYSANNIILLNILQININIHFILYSIIISAIILNFLFGFKNLKTNKKIALLEFLISVIFTIFIIQEIINIFNNITDLIKTEEILKYSYIFIIGLLSFIILIFNRKYEKNNIKKYYYFIFIIAIIITVAITLAPYIIRSVIINKCHTEIFTNGQVHEYEKNYIKAGKSNGKCQYIDEYGSLKLEIPGDFHTSFIKAKKNNIYAMYAMILNKNTLNIINIKGDILFSFKINNYLLEQYGEKKETIINYGTNTEFFYMFLNGATIVKDYKIKEYGYDIASPYSNEIYVDSSWENKNLCNYYKITDSKIIKVITLMDTETIEKKELPTGYVYNEYIYDKEYYLIDITKNESIKLDCDNLYFKTLEQQKEGILLYKNGMIPYSKKSNNENGYFTQSGEKVSIPYNYTIIDFMNNFIVLKDHNQNDYFFADSNFNIISERYKNIYFLKNVYIVQKQDFSFVLLNENLEEISNKYFNIFSVQATESPNVIKLYIQNQPQKINIVLLNTNGQEIKSDMKNTYNYELPSFFNFKTENIYYYLDTIYSVNESSFNYLKIK